MENTETSSYHENPFFVLGVAPTDNADAIEQAAGDRFFDSPDGDERAYEDAKAILLTPQKRIAAELRWFCGTIASEVQAMCDCLDRGERYRSAFPNMLAEFTFLANTLPSQTPDELVKTIRRLDEIHRALTPEKLMAIVNDDREIAKFPPVQQETLQAAWEEVRVDVRRTFHALGERLGKESYVKLANDVAQRAFGKKADYGRIVETFLENYELDVSTDVEQQSGPLADLLKAIDPKNVREEELRQLESMVPALAALTQPLTAWHVAQGLVEGDLGVDIFYAVRSRAIDIYNDGHDIASSQRLMQVLKTAFPLLPEDAQKKLALDLETLEENEKAAQHSPDYDKTLAFIRETLDRFDAYPKVEKGSNEHAYENSVFYIENWCADLEPRLRRMLASASCTQEERQDLERWAALLYMTAVYFGDNCVNGKYDLPRMVEVALHDAEQEEAYARSSGDQEALKDAGEWLELLRDVQRKIQASAQEEEQKASRKTQQSRRKKARSSRPLSGRESGIFEKVRDILVEQLGIEPDEVTIDAAIIDDLGADSLDGVEIVMACEEEFNIEVPDEAIEKIHTVRDIVYYIEQSSGVETAPPAPAPRRPQPRPVSLEKPSAPPAPQSQPQRQQQTGGSKFGRLAAAALLLLAVGFGAYHIGASNSAPKAPSMMTTQATTSNSSKPIQKAAKREMKSDLSLGGLDLDMSIDDVRKTLGKENTSEQRGKFNFLLYDNVEVGTYENTVRALVSNGPSAQTKRGIHEGSTLADVQKAYGTDAMVTDYDDLKLYEYSFKSVAGNDGLLRFAVKKSDNTVKYISVRIPEDEKPATKKAAKLDPNEAAQALNDYYQGITHGDARSSYNLLSADMQKHMGSFDQFTSGYQTTLSHKLTDLTLVKQEDPYVTIGYTLTARDRTNTSRVKVQTFHCEATLSKATGSWHIVNVSAKKQSEHME